MVIFYRFPRDSDIKKQWVLAVNRIKPSDRSLWEPGVTDYVCSKHFTERDYSSTAQRKRLRPLAVPSVFPHRPPTSSSERTIRYVSSYGQVPVIVTPTLPSEREDTLKRKLQELSSNIRNSRKR